MSMGANYVYNMDLEKRSKRAKILFKSDGFTFITSRFRMKKLLDYRFFSTESGYSLNINLLKKTQFLYRNSLKRSLLE